MAESKTQTDPSVLYESPDKAILVLDIPATLELAQIPPHDVNTKNTHGDPPPDSRRRRRILSAQPVTEPYATPEPKKRSAAGAQNKSPASQVADLMTAAAVDSALGHVSEHYDGPWHLPRVVEETDPRVAAPGTDPYIPERARFIQGQLGETSETLRSEAPAFDLIVLDPPWPNRSARRKTDSYSTVYSLSDMDDLLDNVPVRSHLKANGLLAVWVTNKSSILDSVTSSSGLFAQWGLEMVAEWTWLKVTRSGEPIYDIHSEWRKPWEKLLISKRIGAPTPKGLRSKTILAVPDLHSRKPNLRGLFGEVLGPDHVGLEVFARNLIVGWWAWGDETLRFQAPECWDTLQ